MSKRVVALKDKSLDNYFLLPTSDGRNMIMYLKEDGTWEFRKGHCTWEEVSNYGTLEPLYELVVD